MKINILLSDDTVLELLPSEWKEVPLILKNRRISDLILTFENVKFFTKTNADGYFFIQKILCTLNSNKSDILAGIGYLDKKSKYIYITWINCITMSVVNMEKRNYFRSVLGLIENQ
jgi:hypothetical protein